jgi:hypothetical protein
MYTFDETKYTFEEIEKMRVWLTHRESNHPCPYILYNNGKLPSSAPPHNDWVDWWFMSRKERKRLKEKHMRTITTSNEAGTLSTTFIPFKEMANDVPPIPKLKETKMYHHTNDPHAAMREHLYYRLDRICEDKLDKLGNIYGINDDPMPTSGEEIVKRIKDGHFIPRDEKQFNQPNAYFYTNNGVLSAFRWRKPDLKEDKDGFRTAHEQLLKEKTTLSDSITIHEPVKALEEIRKFEDKKLH